MSDATVPGMATSPQGVGGYTEDQLLERILPLMAGGRDDVLGPGDDAAVLRLDGPPVVTTDALVLGRDWRDDWSTPAQVAAKAVTQNLADIAAMGAVPTSLLCTLLLDPETPVEWVERFAAALGVQSRRYAVSVAGGDLSSAPAGLRAVAITAFGELEGRDPVTRAGARPGDRIAVTGSLGRSAVGLALLLAASSSGQGVDDLPVEALAHHLTPTAPLSQGPVAALAGAGAMIDLSDGLSRDADRVARASGVRLVLEADALAADLNWAENFIARGVARQCVLGGGEEHSLLACFPGEVPPFWRVLGRVEQAGTGEPGVWLDGRPLPVTGWDHFARPPAP